MVDDAAKGPLGPQVPVDPGAAHADAPIKIELAEVPLPKPRSMRTVPEPDLPARPLDLAAIGFDEPPSPVAQIKTLVGKAYFDPFQAFYENIDKPKLIKTHKLLILIAFFGPMLFVLLTSFLAAGIHHAFTALNSTRPANLFFEAAIYPIVYLFANGYWIYYIVLPALVIALGWLWAAATSWNLARDSDANFKNMLHILATLGAMFASFTLFPFLRIVAFIFIIFFVAKKMKKYFQFQYGKLSVRGGVFLIPLMIIYTMVEFKLENGYFGKSQLSDNLNAYYLSNKPLPWPTFRRVALPSSHQAILNRLGHLDPAVRARGIREALPLLERANLSPELRFELASRMANGGEPLAMHFLAQAYASGKGTRVDLPHALHWAQQASQADPKQLKYNVEVANLLFLNNRRLEGKRKYVAIVKQDPDNIHQVAEAIRKEGRGNPMGSLLDPVKRLYKRDESVEDVFDAAREEEDEKEKYFRKIPVALTPLHLSRQGRLLARLAEKNPDDWFLRALIQESDTTLVAGPATYGEPLQGVDAAEILKQLDPGDPIALETAGDQFFSIGDVANARLYWNKAILSLDSDKRRTNANIYLKIANSYESDGKVSQDDKNEFVRCCLGFVLLSDDSIKSNSRVIQNLNKLGVVIKEGDDLGAYPFLSTCTRYGVPEAWAIMGSCWANGNFAGQARNLQKAKECLLKAKQLGYRGPLVNALG